MGYRENRVTLACMKMLTLYNVFHWRNNSGAVRVGKRFIRFGAPGSPDILGLLAPRGLFFGVECKTDTGKQTPAQLAFSKEIAMAGGVYLLVRTSKELEDWLIEYQHAITARQAAPAAPPPAPATPPQPP